MTTVNTRKDLMIGSNRDIIIQGGGDLRVTRTPEEYLSNFLAVTVGDIVKRLIGSPQSGAVYESARSQIYEALQENEQVGFVLAVEITRINTERGAITINVELQEEPDFELEIEVA